VQPSKRKRDPEPNTVSKRLRSSTKQQTLETKQRQATGHPPVNRLRRKNTTYKNVNAFNSVGTNPDKDMNDAIRAKRVFSGFRKDVSWSTGFPATFWSQPKFGGQWQCAIQGDNCKHPNLTADHSDLEIGHVHGFYNQVVSKVDPIVVCDESSHWEVYRYRDVVAANEDLSNLEPQCGACNRSVRQQRKDDHGGGKYQPEKKGHCPGKGKCTAIRLSFVL
jgi:hypothetical protein